MLFLLGIVKDGCFIITESKIDMQIPKGDEQNHLFIHLRVEFCQQIIPLEVLFLQIKGPPFAFDLTAEKSFLISP